MLWAITSYYNPVKSKRRLSNYRIFRANLRVPLVAIELSFDGHFELTDDDADILIQIAGGAVLWQKERLLNTAIKSVPQNVTNIAWVDCDVVFERTDWVHKAEEQLRKNNIVQLFSDLVDLTSEGYQSNVKYDSLRPSGRGIVSAINGGTLAQLGVATETWEAMRAFSCGLAWAARRSILEGHGLYDAMIVGGGDTTMVHTIYGQFEKEVHLHNLNRAREEHYLRWAQPYHKAVAEKVGNVPGRLYHLWHGKIINRRYRDRYRLLANFDFEPNTDLVVGPKGAWQWARPRPDLEKFLLKFFLCRAEDE